jgi:hypothetical protein
VRAMWRGLDFPTLPALLSSGRTAPRTASNSGAAVDALKALRRCPIYTRHEGLGHVETCAVSYADDRFRGMSLPLTYIT